MSRNSQKRSTLGIFSRNKGTKFVCASLYLRNVISGCPTAVNTSSKLGTTGRCRSGWRPSTPVPAGRPRAPLRGLRPFRLRARRPRGRRRASSRWGRVRRSRHSSLSHHRLGQPFQYYSVLITKSRSICSILPSNSDDF